jgi:hypothetical protein
MTFSPFPAFGMSGRLFSDSNPEEDREGGSGWVKKKE